MSATVTQAEVVTEQPSYRVSTLFTGFVRMWRAWKFVLPAIVINAVLQGLLVIPVPLTGYSPVFLLTVILSAVILLALSATIAAAALDSAVGPATWSSAWQRIRGNGGWFTLWTVALAIVVLIGLAIYTLPGLLILAIVPFLTLAAMFGQRNAFVANFRVIGARPLRWIITMIIIGILLFFTWVAMALTGFFGRPIIGAMLSTLVGGLLLWWWQTSLALIFRSVFRDDPSGGEPSLPE
ncbi:MAG: hypothetical protein WCP28_11560 [Actinomycetes bacterium]